MGMHGMHTQTQANGHTHIYIIIYIYNTHIGDNIPEITETVSYHFLSKPLQKENPTGADIGHSSVLSSVRGAALVVRQEKARINQARTLSLERLRRDPSSIPAPFFG